MASGLLIESKMIRSEIKKGFTLIEVLIATAIFAVVMIMTTAVVSQSVGFQSKIRAVRQSSQESRKLADLISRDIRSAKGSFKIAFNTGTGPNQSVEFKNGMGVFGCIYGGGCKNYDDFLSGTSPANALVIADGKKLKIYWFVRVNAKAVYYYEYDLTDLDTATGLVKQSDGSQLRLDQIVAQSSADAGGDPTKNLIAGSASSVDNPQTPDIKTVVNFTRFYCPAMTTPETQQNFIGLNIRSEVGIASSKPTDHAISSINTLVTTRSYGL